MRFELVPNSDGTCGITIDEEAARELEFLLMMAAIDNGVSPKSRRRASLMRDIFREHRRGRSMK